MIKHIDIKGNNHRNKKGILQQFLTEAQKYKPLTFEQERTATRDQLINHNMLFAASVAFRYDTAQVDIMDLISEAMFGLIKAADTFNPAYENKFISYALFQIQRYIKDFIDTKKNCVRLPHRISQVRYQIGKYEETDSYLLSEKLNIPENIIKSAQSITGFVSLDDTNFDGDIIYQVASDDQTDKHVLQLELKELYNEVTECLTGRELEVLRYRYFDNFPQDLSQVAEKLKVCRERVRQIEKQAYKKIRNKYANGI
jgi:RNA polymerase primary sigma factor